jgi:hypothetical protein
MNNGTASGFDAGKHNGMIDTEVFMELALAHVALGLSLKEAVEKGRSEFTAMYPDVDSLVGIFLHPKGIEAYYDVADKFDRYHTLYRSEGEGSVFICSENMDVEGISWTPYREMGGILSVPSFRKP